LATPLHPALQRAYDILEHEFFEEKFLEAQNVFGSDESCKIVFDMLDETLRSDFTFLMAEEDPHKKWQQLKNKVKQLAPKAKGFKAKETLRALLPQIVFSFCYPRLDINVSKQLNHLLKSPFCVHPKTGRVCVPIDPEFCHEFDPFDVPTLGQLEHEINELKIDLRSDADTKVWAMTSLKKYIEHFERFVQPLFKAGQAKKLKAAKANGIEDF